VGKEPTVEDGFRLNWVGPIAIVVCGILIRLTDRTWLVDWFDALSLSEAANRVTSRRSG
jgi:hypothetical protein